MSNICHKAGSSETLDLRVPRGGDIRILVEVYNLAETIADAEVLLTVKKSFLDTDADAVLQLQVGQGITIEETNHSLPPQTFLIVATGEQTKAIPPGVYLYDVRMKLAGSGQTFFPIVPSRLTIRGAVTSEAA